VFLLGTGVAAGLVVWCSFSAYRFQVQDQDQGGNGGSVNSVVG
jgi:hypothetical protein